MNRKLRDKLILVATCLTLLWCIPSFGQVLKGSISGTAVDQQGAVVSGAQVKATNIGTAGVLTTTTDNSGSFRFNLIPAGEYKIEISAQHFKTAVQSNVVVTAGRDSGLGTVKLTVGETSTTVEVTADAPLIETTQAQVTNTFSGVQLSSFAGVQENQGLDNLALFVPGVSSVRDNSFSNTNGGVGFSSNGLRGRNNDQQIDGQNNNDNSVGGPGLFVSDAEFVSQYVLVTNQFGPEYGRNSGSVVNVVTKSGSNAWHGSIYGAENNSILNSLSNFQKNSDICDTNCLTKPPRSNNEFTGFTIGGPWIKNKLFFFGGFDDQIISQSNIFSSGNLTPTPAGLAALAACFPTGIQNDAVLAITKFGPYGVSGGNPQVNGTPVAGIVGACPAATFAGVTRTVSQPVHNFNWVIKQDLQLGSDSITARYIFNRGNSFNIGDNGAAGYFFNVPALSQAVMASWTHNLSAHMVNEARISFGRLNVEFGGNSFGTEPTAGQLDQALTNVAFSVGGLLGYGPATNLPQARIVNTWQAQDNWNLVWGKHQLKAGVNWTYQRSPNIFLPTINGAYRFSSWSSYFNNTPNRVRVALGPSSLDFREYDTFLYGGDDWKISQNLTIQLGLTWSYYGQPANIFNDITTKRESNAATAFWNPALPLSVRTLPTIPAPKDSLGPAVGFVYSPQWGGFLTGHGKTTFRGGYRMLYDPPFYNIYLNVATSAPEVFLNSVPSPGTHPLPANPTGPNVRAALASSLTPGVFDPRTFAQTNITPDFGPDKIHTWTFGLERELSKNSVIEARYVGNHATNLFQTVNANPLIGPLQADFPNLVPAGLTPCAASNLVGPGAAVAVGRVSCDEGILRQRTNTGYSNYHALQTEFRANNLFKQLTIRTAYTFSKTLDNVSEIFSTFGGGNTTFTSQNPANLKGPGEYSRSGLDYPHQLSLIVTEQLPFMKEQHGAIGHILGGWALSANYIIASGQNYTPAQLFAASALNPDYYDAGFFGNFNSGVEAIRPFIGNLNAPATAVGIYAGDACNLFNASATGGACAASVSPTQLLSATAMGPNCIGSLVDCAVVPVTKDQVRFIVNSNTSQGIFGTPFGNAPRNPVRDEISNIANFSIIKNIKLGEKANFEFHTTFLNVMNHPNFGSVDPFIEDAGLHGAFNGFGDVTQTNSTPRTIFFTGKITF
ncbi:MAG: TonB-dependent receptor [Acidobacteriia bacterium]|nr:TonB-dependent receptor [Terriglobia bacterium]